MQASSVQFCRRRQTAQAQAIRIVTRNETMRPEDLSRVPALPRSRKDDAIRRLFSVRPSQEAKVAIAERFKAFRYRSGMTQARLGEIVGICRQSINEIENCRVYPHYTTIHRFADLEQRHEEARRITASLCEPFWR